MLVDSVEFYHQCVGGIVFLVLFSFTLIYFYYHRNKEVIFLSSYTWNFLFLFGIIVFQFTFLVPINDAIGVPPNGVLRLFLAVFSLILLINLLAYKSLFFFAIKHGMQSKMINIVVLISLSFYFFTNISVVYIGILFRVTYLDYIIFLINFLFLSFLLSLSYGCIDVKFPFNENRYVFYTILLVILLVLVFFISHIIKPTYLLLIQSILCTIGVLGSYIFIAIPKILQLYMDSPDRGSMAFHTKYIYGKMKFNELLHSSFELDTTFYDSDCITLADDQDDFAGTDRMCSDDLVFVLNVESGCSDSD